MAFDDTLATQTGFTLLEVLVVLLIMGVMAGLVSAMLLPDDRARLDVETGRLAQLLALAGEQAQASGQAIAWTVQPPGYRFWRRSPETGWTEMGEDQLLRPRELPAGMAVTGLRVENAASTGPMRLEFSADGASTAFTVELSMAAARSAIAGSPVGEVVVVPGEGVRDAVPSPP